MYNRPILLKYIIMLDNKSVLITPYKISQHNNTLVMLGK